MRASLGGEIAHEQDLVLGARGVSELDLLKDNGQSRKRALARYRKIAIALGCLCVVAATIVVTIALRFPMVRCSVDAEVPSARGAQDISRWMVASAHEPKKAAFSDGTMATLAPGTRLRLVGFSRRGAAMTLESGSIEMQVVGTRITEYQMSVGPFSVTMTRGQVRVAWDPMTETLELNVNEGMAVISGCQFDVGRSLGAGKLLEARCQVR
ncbi:MAG TPA: hypothetical protein VIV60_03025 [Polyangiaceae bacterium]